MAGSRGKSRVVTSLRKTAGYSGTTLPKKLGIGPDFQVLLIGAPVGFENTLGKIQVGARLLRRTLKRVWAHSANPDLALWFVDSIDELKIGVRHFSTNCPRTGLWIIWRKKSALRKEEIGTALGENQIREVVLSTDLVDFKVCAVDETWSGLKVTTRKEAKSGSK